MTKWTAAALREMSQAADNVVDTLEDADECDRIEAELAGLQALAGQRRRARTTQTEVAMQRADVAAKLKQARSGHLLRAPRGDLARAPPVALTGDLFLLRPRSLKPAPCG